MGQIIEIQQVTVSSWPQTVTANRAQVSQIIVTPNNAASGHLLLGNEVADQLGNLIFVPVVNYTTVAMTPEQYAAWGTDDDYAIDCILTNAGLTRI